MFGLGELVIAPISYLDLGNFKVNSSTDKNCSLLTYLDLAIGPSSIATESAFSTRSGNRMKSEAVASLNMAMTTQSAQVTDTSSRNVFFKQSRAVLSATTDSKGMNTIKDSLNEIIKGYVGNKDYEHISDDNLSPKSEDTKDDDNITSEYTKSSGKWLYQRWTQTA